MGAMLDGTTLGLSKQLAAIQVEERILLPCELIIFPRELILLPCELILLPCEHIFIPL